MAFRKLANPKIVVTTFYKLFYINHPPPAPLIFRYLSAEFILPFPFIMDYKDILLIKIITVCYLSVDISCNPRIPLLKVNGDSQGITNLKIPSLKLKFFVKYLYLWNLNDRDDQYVERIFLGDYVNQSGKECEFWAV